MPDIIQLLPDSIANQIAAGEVIQRPASVVKELMENALDAGASSIQVIIKDAGKALIQVIDNGCGMSSTDARMGFERHATSKIREASDLFSIRTRGFRGEALASIAAIAQVELKTRLHNEELGTRLVIEGSQVKKEEKCATEVGSIFTIKNIFYNTPARRNFLKSSNIEFRHISEEFQRIALAHPDIFLSLSHNGKELAHYPKTNLRQRVVNVFGKKTNERIAPLDEGVEGLRIHGFIGKPEAARKSRGDQYFFVNDRFIKSGYLHHAIMNAYEDLLPPKTWPFYIIYLELNPADIDINVHPTKQEIKFKDERIVYNYLRVSVKHALGQSRSMPTLSFDRERIFDQPSRSAGHGSNEKPAWSPDDFQKANVANWEKLFDIEPQADTVAISAGLSVPSEIGQEVPSELGLDKPTPIQLHQQFIIAQVKSGFMLIHQKNAHERILYERYLVQVKEASSTGQTELFPKTLSFGGSDHDNVMAIMPVINKMGFDLQEFGNGDFVLHAIPSGFQSDEADGLIETILDQYKMDQLDAVNPIERVARSLAFAHATRKKMRLNHEEMGVLIDQLFACQEPQYSPRGKKCFKLFELSELGREFDVSLKNR